jgi:hypothetical protein
VLLVLQLALFLALPQVTTVTADTPPPFDPRPAVERAIHALDESAPDHTRFTYHKREHIITQVNGRVVYDVTHTYDVTWINDRPYWRLIALNDQPLPEKDQQNEQKLYDKAIAKHKDLGGDQRASMADITIFKNDGDLHMALGPLYTFTEKAHETNAAGVTEHLVEARLVPKAKPKSNCKWRFQFWITEPDDVVRRYVADVPDSKDPECANSRDQATFSIVDGVIKPARWSSRFYPEPGTGEAAINDDLYTDYQWFSTSDSMGAATVTKPKTPAPDAPPATPTNPPQ